MARRAGRHAAVTLLASVALSCGWVGTEPGDRELLAPLWRVSDVSHRDWWFYAPATEGTRLLIARDSALVALDVRDGHELWRTAAVDAERFTIAHNIVIADGRAFLSLRDAVLAFDVRTGELAWRSAPMPGLDGAFLAIADDGLFVAPGAAMVARLDLSTGAVRWLRSLGSAPAFEARTFGIRVAADTLYLGGVEFLDANGLHRRGIVTALSATDGAVLWRYTLPDSASDGGRAPAVHDSLLVDVDYYGNSMFALDRFRATMRWRTAPIEGSVGADGTPVLVGDTVFAAVGDRRIVALDVRTGAQRWSAPVGSTAHGSVAVCATMIVVNTQALTVVDRRTHRSRGEMQLVLADGTDDIPTAQFVVADGRLFVTTEFGVRAYRC